MTTVNYTTNNLKILGDNYPRFYSLFMESSIIGLMTLIFGKITYDFINNRNPFNKKNILKNKKNIDERNKICITLFLVGFIIHVFNEMLGLNCYYCSKQCVQNVSKFI
tara:strand:- start:70 stop:393 length:324 start_codon:yes stop_codon:yes gene_type:complete